MDLRISIPSSLLDNTSSDFDLNESGNSNRPSRSASRLTVVRSRSTTSTTSSSSTCHLCGYESGRQSNLKRHMKTMHQLLTSSTNKCFECCDISFQDKAKYREHCREVHRNGHECSICHRGFSRRALLRRHQSVHTGYKEFNCTFCHYASSHKSNLERHLKTHTISKPTTVAKISQKLLLQSPAQTQPDSTTSYQIPPTPTSGISLEFPILRNILKITSPTKVKLSHSIESILNRKDIVKNIPIWTTDAASSLLPVGVEGTPKVTSNQSEFPSQILQEGRGIKTTEFTQEIGNIRSEVLSAGIGFHSTINHSSTSSFTSPGFTQQNLINSKLNQEHLRGSLEEQDLRILSANYHYPSWIPVVEPCHFGNYAYHPYYYTNNRESTGGSHCYEYFLPFIHKN